MISAFLLALAALSSPADLSSAGYAPDTIRHLKGHASLPAPSERKDDAVPAVCHPDPTKGRICRHHIAKKQAAHREALASADTAGRSALPQ